MQTPPALKIFLCGDVMTGRGIDQILPHSCDPRLFEPWIRDARKYVTLAETANGPIKRPVDFKYIWGDALQLLDDWHPDLRVINLETSITTSRDHWPGKNVHYRMHPGNTGALSAAKIDCCVLANNHVLDWGYKGLKETLTTLHRAGIQTTGAGASVSSASAPAIFDFGARGRVLVFAWGTPSSGVTSDWAATSGRPGVNWIADFSDQYFRAVTRCVNAHRRDGDCVIASIHWGGNWGYTIPADQMTFARRLIDEGGIHIVHGHSSHHPKAFEIYRDQPIFYGCGDLLNDYEGIAGHEEFRSHLTMMFMVEVDTTSKKVVRLGMKPMRIRNFQLQHASSSEAAWLLDVVYDVTKGVTHVRSAEETGRDPERGGDRGQHIPGS